MKVQPLNIGQQVQLFLDNHIIEMVHFTTRTMHSPRKRPEPVIRKDRPWEVLLYFRTNTFNVYYDAQESLYKCWYEDSAWDYEAYMGRGKGASGSLTPGAYCATADERYLYAESKDGIEWDKPALDHRDVDGQKTNICLGNEQIGPVHSCSVLLDPIDRDPEKRFKAIYWHPSDLGAERWVAAAFSPDGRKWTLYDEHVSVSYIAEHPLGDVIILTADPASGEYHLDTRVYGMCERYLNPKNPTAGGWAFPNYPSDPWRITARRIYATVSDNILNWPTLREMLVPDDLDDNLDYQYYGMTRFRMGDLWLAFAVVHRQVANTQEIHLLFSRDGYNWKHAGEHQPFLGLGAEGAWDEFMVETCTPPVFLDDEIRIYYAGGNLHHDWWMFGEQEGLEHPEVGSGWGGGELALGLATLRPEGFVSIDSGLRDSIVITRPFVSDGDHLIMNVDCGSRGYLDVELADANDDVVPGYERSACDTFTGDETRHVVTWQGRSQLPAEVLAKGAKLRFWNRYCSIYSFRIGGAA